MREAKIVLLVRDKKFHILECDAFRTLKAIITVIPVSYTHLDVYKRQVFPRCQAISFFK